MIALVRLVPLSALLLTSCTNALEASWCEENAIQKVSNCAISPYIAPFGIFVPECLRVVGQHLEAGIFLNDSPHSLEDRQRLCVALGNSKGELSRNECIADGLPAADVSCTFTDADAVLESCQGSSEGTNAAPPWVSDCSINFEDGFRMSDDPRCCTDHCWITLDGCLQTCSPTDTAACIDCSEVCLEERRRCAQECYR
jgi:hypothetical protein